MNTKEIISKGLVFELMYNPTRGISLHPYSDSFSIRYLKNHDDSDTISFQNHIVLHFFGLDTDKDNSDGLQIAKEFQKLLRNKEKSNRQKVEEYLLICDKQPFLLVYLRSMCRLYADAESTFEQHALKDLNNLIKSYNLLKQYISDILVRPYQHHKYFPPINYFMMNELFCSEIGNKSIYLALNEKYQLRGNGSFSSYDEYLKHLELIQNSSKYGSFLDYENYIQDCNDRFYVIFVLFMQYMINNESYIGYCPNCHCFYISRYTSRTNYCSRIYANTAATCQEYASTRAYQDRKKENPIHSLYIKCYNKLYARVRRGKLEADSPLFQELINLRDQYFEKYEREQTEAVVEEFARLSAEL